MSCKVLIPAVLITLLLAGCAGGNSQTPPEETVPAEKENSENTKEASSDGIRIENAEIKVNPVFRSTDIQIDYEDLQKRGFEFGDSILLTFSNGVVMDDVPYHNGYYVKPGNPVAVYYPGLYGLNLAYNLGEGSWDKLGFSEGDTVTIELKEKEKYLNEQNTFAQTHSDDIHDYESAEKFANFRALAGGNLLPNLVFRSATMTNNSMYRADVTDDLAEQYGIRAVLDFSDTEETLAELRTKETWNSDYFDRLYDQGLVDVVGLGVNPASEEFHKDLAQALYRMIQKEGPYLFFCTEGKDRTGYTATLIEALCGSSYDEMLDDYLKTYEYYYGMSRETTPEQCQAAIDTSFDPIIRIMFELSETEDLRSTDYAPKARLFLQKGGLSDQQIDEMIRVFTGK